ncbi:hypothetical protein [Caballeronia sp. ATUFL_M2_KS44]|uniref:hypothetical protein n=1 Tax=Caballeronia sp. ATUFL_M2_KS44 TaxID=2921767 RepID=UPI002029799E|nr:hypothetical protein [Caballeronia sp. ATUFL_M2_KS44]
MAAKKTVKSKPAVKKATGRKTRAVETTMPTENSNSISEFTSKLDSMTAAEALELLRGGRPPLSESEISGAAEEDFIRRLGVAMLEMLSPEQTRELRRAFDQVSDAAEAADEAARKAGEVLSDFDMEAADVEALERVLSGG